MEILNDVDIDVTVNLTANTSHEVLGECSTTAPTLQRNKRSRQFLDRVKKV